MVEKETTAPKATRHGSPVVTQQHVADALGIMRAAVSYVLKGQAEHHVDSSGGFADEVICLPDGRRIMGCITWRHWGSSICFFEMEDGPNGGPEKYRSPFPSNRGRSKPCCVLI